MRSSMSSWLSNAASSASAASNAGQSVRHGIPSSSSASSACKHPVRPGFYSKEEVTHGGVKRCRSGNVGMRRLALYGSNRSANLIVAAAATQVSAYDELAKLAALRDQGVVTEQEFQQKKEDLLAKM